MFDNVAFEVVIGLVFIFLLYSLLITILGEIVSTQLGIRARLLRVAIERMLNDGYYQKLESNKGKKWQGWIRKTFLYEPAEFNMSFAGRFYEYPAIKYLGRIEDNYRGVFNSSKPSYMSPDYFAETLIAFLMDKGNGVTDMDRIRFTLRYNTYNIQPKTLKQFRNLFESSDKNRALYKANLIKWFNETMDRANGWHKRKMRTISFVLGFIVAVLFNINSISIAGILSNDRHAREALVRMGIELAKDSARYETFVTKNGDSIRSNTIIDSGFARIQKDIHAAAFIMGLGWQTDTLRKKDSIRIRPKDKAYRLLAPDTGYINKLVATHDLAKRSVSSKRRSIAVIRDSIRMFIPDSLLLATGGAQPGTPGVPASADEAMNRLRQTHLMLQQRLEDTLQTLNKDSLILNTTSKLIADREQLILPLVGGGYTSVDRITPGKDHSLTMHGKRKLSFWESVGYVLYLVFAEYGWAGLLLTAIALSLGAPFWFDLLNKLVSIRGVGVKPEEKQIKQAETGQEDMMKEYAEKVYTNDPVEYAIYLYRDALEAIPGVLAVNYEYTNTGDNKKTPGIEVSVTSACDTRLIPANYEVVLDDRAYTVPVFITETQAAALHISLNAKNQVLGVQNNLNKSSDAGWGTVTGIVMNKKSQKKAILSCSHVLRGHYDEVDADEKRLINDHAGNHVASLYYYVHSNTLDAAYADTVGREITGYTPIKNYQEIGRTDAEMETEIVMDGFVSGKQEGRIINHRTHFPFQVNGKFLTMVNLVKIARREGDKRKSISTYGDSGALVTRKADDMPLAMIIGGTDEFSFAITLKEVFESLYIEPLKDTV